MSTQLVSNFEVLLEPITPFPPTSGSGAKSASGSGGKSAAAAGPTMPLSRVPKRFRLQGDAAASFPVPEVIQGYFLLIGNPVGSPSVAPTITVEADQYTINLIVSSCLALTQIDGQPTQGKFTDNGNRTASVTLPTVAYGANFAIVGNYLGTGTPPLDLRGNVYITVNTGATLVLTPQTRAIFTTGSTTPPGEVAYSMITPTGGSLFSFTSTADNLFEKSAKDAAPAKVAVPAVAGKGGGARKKS